MASADGNNGCWVALGLLIALPVVLALWPLILAAGLVGLVIWGVGSYPKLMLEQDTAVWSTRHQGMVCRCGSHHGLVEGLSLVGDNKHRRLVLALKLLEAKDTDVEFTSVNLPLPNLNLAGQSFAAALNQQLRANDVKLVDELAVEHQAMRTAEAWLQELHWSRQALSTLMQMDTDLKRTLAMAPGNELLEPAIPQLEEARQRIATEWTQVQDALREALDVLQQLVAFLSVPASVRGVLTFELGPVHDTGRLKALRQSFDDVVLLNNVFRELSAQRRA